MSKKINNIIFIIFLSLCNTLSAYSQNYVVFRIDDMGLDDFNVYYQILPLFEKNNAKLTIGVVPIAMQQSIDKGEISSEDIDFIKKYIDKGVVEIAQHGFAHNANYQSDQIVSEFYKVEYEKQYKEIKEGKEYLDLLFNEKISTFIPPWNAYDDNTVTALVNSGFSTISAARYGAIEYGIMNLKYLPYSITLVNFFDRFSQFFKESHSNIDEGKVFVVMIHAYDFKFNNKGSKGRIGKEELNHILHAISEDTSFRSLTIKGLISTQDIYDNTRLKNSAYEKRKFIRYIYLPKKLLLEPSTYKKLNIFEKKLYLFVAIFYYACIILIGYIISLLSTKLFNAKVNKIIMQMVFLFLLLCLLLFLFSVSAKIAITCIFLALGYISINILNKV